LELLDKYLYKYLDNIVVSVLQANANSAASLSEAEIVFLNNSNTLFHVFSVPFLTPTHSTVCFTSGGILIK